MSYHQYQQFKRMSAQYTPTTPDIEGPFYKPGAPYTTKLTQRTHMTLEGAVYDTDGNPVADALLDFWQADENGVYDNVGFDLRGKQNTRLDGSYLLDTVQPGHYDISDPSAPQPHEYRCGHIHVKFSAPGYKSLTTQLYFAGDQYNDTDHWFSKDRVVSRVTPTHYRFTFVVEKA